MRSSRSHVWLIRPAQTSPSPSLSCRCAKKYQQFYFPREKHHPAASRYSNFTWPRSFSTLLFLPFPSPAFFPRRLSLERPRRRLQAPLINFDSSDPLSLSSRLSSMDDIFDRIFGRRVREEAWKRVNLKAFCRPRFRNVARFPPLWGIITSARLSLGCLRVIPRTDVYIYFCFWNVRRHVFVKNFIIMAHLELYVCSFA